MKKIFAWLLLTAMALGLFSGCGSKKTAQATTPATQAATTPATQPTEPAEKPTYEPTLQGAVAYLKDKYPCSEEPIRSMTYHLRTKKVQIGAKVFLVEWTVDVTDPKIVRVVPATDEVCTININGMYTEETNYTLTATVTDSEGNSVTQDWKYILPRYLEALNLFEAGEKLKNGERLPEAVTVTGTVLSVDVPADSGFITITIAYGDGQLVCRNLRTGNEDISQIAVGDTVKVKGMIIRLDDVLGFESKCILMEHTTPA